MTITHPLAAIFIFMLLCTSLTAFAEDAKTAKHHDMHSNSQEKHGKQCDSHKAKQKKRSHHMGSHWAKTLSDEQKQHVDRMHLALDSDLLVLKARAELVQKEINVLTANDDVDMKAVDAKIDDYMAIKTQIMRARYAHLTEMRVILTTEQRVSYDMGILKRSGAK